MLKKSIISIASAALFFCCGQNPLQTGASSPKKNLMENVKWFIGDWENTSGQTLTGESWKVKNDSCYTGFGFFIKGGDTLFRERIELCYKAGRLFYIPTVLNQNKGLPVTFTLTASSDSAVAFENPAHDFPQTIRYTRIHSDSIVAEVSGKSEGKFRSDIFPFRRRR